MCSYVSPLCAAASDQDGDVYAPQGEVGGKTRPATKKPAMYKVLLLNDDYTPMDFVEN